MPQNIAALTKPQYVCFKGSVYNLNLKPQGFGIITICTIRVVNGPQYSFPRSVLHMRSVNAKIDSDR